ncbi:signal transduction histidine kinase [Azospirillum fermentarium]|uniref:sensor histidine kinase n=1 Tax=Azospirillum fermentarium TaxID=1233114 RepID=UPI002227AD2D|nr:sensor histidine kinase [Azospirillum fermentarium]MCW2246195.1 signal transduction histidine kinase [Azospirillum fermentarium]
MIRRSVRSLGFRLVAGAALWITAALAASWVGMTALFHAHVAATVEEGLANDLDRLLAALETGPGGALVLPQRLADPQFDRPFSGRYWQVMVAGRPPLRCRSLWDSVLEMPDDGVPDGKLHRHVATGPKGERLVAVERTVTLPDLADLAEPVRVIVAVDSIVIDRAEGQFRWAAALSLAVLGAGLVLAVLVQVRYGLRPLSRLRTALNAVRDGASPTVTGQWPAEVAPLVADLNALIEHDAAVVARARAQAGDLAHALKTPLTVLANESAERPDRVPRLVEVMRRHIDRHLARARAAGSAAVPGARTDAASLAHGIGRAIGGLARSRGVSVTVDAGPAAVFRGDREDLAEMLGNLMENAAKWAASQVRVTLAPTGSGPTRRLRVRVEDDGPGLPPERREAVFTRGVRLDEDMPGSGLGLTIVRDLAACYGGTVVLEDSELGGLAAVLDLPGA